MTDPNTVLTATLEDGLIRFVPPQTQRDLADVQRFIGSARVQIHDAAFVGRFGWRLIDAVETQAAHITRLEADVARLTKERDEATNNLRGFMTSFVREHFPDNIGWQPLPDLLGMLTQMDNASTIARDYKAQNKAMREALERQRTNIEHWIETGKAASPEESKSIYDQICAALNQEGGGKPS